MAESTSESRGTSELASTHDASSDASGKVCCVVPSPVWIDVGVVNVSCVCELSLMLSM